MSISNEIIRLKNAKESIKNSIEKRGVTIPSGALIDTYSNSLESAPYSFKGLFTPEVDTQSFSIGGLPCKPCAFYIVCNELYNAGVLNSVIFIAHGNGTRGCCTAYITEGRIATYISENSPLAVWSDSGYKIDLSKSSGSMSDCFFKAGYTYEYYIAGGFPV